MERNRLIRLLVDKVEILETGIGMELRTHGLTTLLIRNADNMNFPNLAESMNTWTNKTQGN